MRLDNKSAILAKRFATHNVRPHSDEGEEDGDAGDPVPAKEVAIRKILLTKNQFESLVGKGAHNSFFNNGKKPPEPAFDSFKRIRLEHTYKDCSAKIVFGVAQDEIEIDEGAKIKNLSITIEETGVASLACTLVAIFPRNLKTLDFENFLGKEIKVSLGFGDLDDEPASTQEKLPLDNAGQEAPEPVTAGDDDEDDDSDD